MDIHNSHEQNTTRSVLEFNYKEARKFFLKSESYFNVELPEYIDIGQLVRSFFYHTLNGAFSLDAIRMPEIDICNQHELNYAFFTNKDGHYEWRKFQFIHPVLYLALVDTITKPEAWSLILHRFNLYQRNPNIKAIGIPVEDSKNKDKGGQIHTWWEKIEQETLKLSLQYSYVLQTDITNCYPSIYTHSFAWALYGKEFVKRFVSDSDKYKVGNTIDKHIRAMQHNQTNGIPQGSVLMDFLAEILLGYIDNRISRALDKEKIKNYYILRYRDDYKIFTNDPLLGERILLLLNQILAEFGFKLNSKKTSSSNSIISSSIKEDKLAWLGYNKSFLSYQGELLNLHTFAIKHPNSGRLIPALEDIYNTIGSAENKKTIHDPMVIIAILVDIMIRNPRIYPICSAVISKMIFHYVPENKKMELLSQIYDKFGRVVNNAYLELWFQRIVIPLGLDENYHYEHRLCQIIQKGSGDLWNNQWIKTQYLPSLSTNLWLLESKKKAISPVINPQEFKVFFNYDLLW